ncbi:MAG: flagellar hook-length control protein FliK [Gammaproteobacteria bacterium]|nr:flagellar hook-length control protein FliK [Gammaproteobacteria bacterium]
MLVATGSGIEFKAGTKIGEPASPPAETADEAVDAANPEFALVLAALNQPVVMTAAPGGAAVHALAARNAADGQAGRTMPPDGNLLPLAEFSQALAQADDDDGLLRNAGMLATAARLGGHAAGDPLASTFGQQLLRRDSGGVDAGLPGLAGSAVRTGLAAVMVPVGQAGAAMSPQQPGFDQALAQRVLVFAQQGIQDARVRVHPEHLGPIEIRIRLEGDGLQVSMASPHAAVREALENALPRLRETLAEQGLDLGHAEVGGGERDEQRKRSDSTQDALAGEDSGLGADSEADAPARSVQSVHGYALIDTFA